MVKNLTANARDSVQSLGWEDPLEEGMTTHSSVLAGESHGQRSLVGYSLGLQSDVTEHTQITVITATQQKLTHCKSTFQ